MQIKSARTNALPENAGHSRGVQFHLKGLLGLVTGVCVLLAMLAALGLDGWQLAAGLLVVFGTVAAIILIIEACMLVIGQGRLRGRDTVTNRVVRLKNGTVVINDGEIVFSRLRESKRNTDGGVADDGIVPPDERQESAKPRTAPHPLV